MIPSRPLRFFATLEIERGTSTAFIGRTMAERSASVALDYWEPLQKVTPTNFRIYLFKNDTEEGNYTLLLHRMDYVFEDLPVLVGQEKFRTEVTIRRRPDLEGTLQIFYQGVLGGQTYDGLSAGLLQDQLDQLNLAVRALETQLLRTYHISNDRGVFGPDAQEIIRDVNNKIAGTDDEGHPVLLDRSEISFISPDTVETEMLQDQSVTTPKIADGAVTGPKVADAGVSLGKLAQDVQNLLIRSLSGDDIVSSTVVHLTARPDDFEAGQPFSAGNYLRIVQRDGDIVYQQLSDDHLTAFNDRLISVETSISRDIQNLLITKILTSRPSDFPTENEQNYINNRRWLRVERHNGDIVYLLLPEEGTGGGGTTSPVDTELGVEFYSLYTKTSNQHLELSEPSSVNSLYPLPSSALHPLGTDDLLEIVGNRIKAKSGRKVFGVFGFDQLSANRAQWQADYYIGASQTPVTLTVGGWRGVGSPGTFRHRSFSFFVEGNSSVFLRKLDNIVGGNRIFRNVQIVCFDVSFSSLITPSLVSRIQETTETDKIPNVGAVQDIVEERANAYPRPITIPSDTAIVNPANMLDSDLTTFGKLNMTVSGVTATVTKRFTLSKTFLSGSVEFLYGLQEALNASSPAIPLAWVDTVVIRLAGNNYVSLARTTVKYVQETLDLTTLNLFTEAQHLKRLYWAVESQGVNELEIQATFTLNTGRSWSVYIPKLRIYDLKFKLSHLEQAIEEVTTVKIQYAAETSGPWVDEVSATSRFHRVSANNGKTWGSAVPLQVNSASGVTVVGFIPENSVNVYTAPSGTPVETRINVSRTDWQEARTVIVETAKTTERNSHTFLYFKPNSIVLGDSLFVALTGSGVTPLIGYVSVVALSSSGFSLQSLTSGLGITKIILEFPAKIAGNSPSGVTPPSSEVSERPKDGDSMAIYENATPYTEATLTAAQISSSDGVTVTGWRKGNDGSFASGDYVDPLLLFVGKFSDDEGNLVVFLRTGGPTLKNVSVKEGQATASTQFRLTEQNVTKSLGTGVTLKNVDVYSSPVSSPSFNNLAAGTTMAFLIITDDDSTLVGRPGSLNYAFKGTRLSQLKSYIAGTLHENLDVGALNRIKEFLAAPVTLISVVSYDLNSVRESGLYKITDSAPLATNKLNFPTDTRGTVSRSGYLLVFKNNLVVHQRFFTAITQGADILSVQFTRRLVLTTQGEVSNQTSWSLRNELQSLLDVSDTAPTEDQVMVRKGTEYVPQAIRTASIADNLSAGEKSLFRIRIGSGTGSGGGSSNIVTFTGTAPSNPQPNTLYIKLASS